MRRAGWLMVLAAGCGAPSVDEYPGELEQAYCEWEQACHRYERVSDCRGARTDDQSPEFKYLQRAVEAGSAEYDRDAAKECLAAISELGCEYDVETPTVCADVFRGRIGRNGPCMSSLECAGNAVCGFDPTCTDMCCVGACRVFADPLAKGEPCGGGAQCADGLYCGSDPMTFQPTVCTDNVKAGGSCINGERCVDDAVCDGSKCVAFKIKQEGEACDGPYDRCEEPAGCRYLEAEGVSRCVAEAGLGEPCDPNGADNCRRFDTFCDPVSRLCKLLPVPGAACAGYECIGYATCQSGIDAQVGTCVARAGKGEACGDVPGGYIECLGDLWCEEAVCVTPEPPVNDKADCPVPGAG